MTKIQDSRGFRAAPRGGIVRRSSRALGRMWYRLAMAAAPPLRSREDQPPREFYHFPPF